MAFGGGTYTKYDKFMPGTYVNTITVGAPQPNATKGTVAVGLVMDWGPDNELFEISATQFQENAEAVTGYAYGDDNNAPLRELFTHASRLVAYKLNSSSAKASKNTGIGVARCSGKAGNKINVTCYKNANDDAKYDVNTYYDSVIKDRQTVGQASVNEMEVKLKTESKAAGLGDEVKNIKVTFSAEKNQLKIAYADVPEGYEITSRLYGPTNMLLAEIPGRMEQEVVGTKSITWTFSPEAVHVAGMKCEARVKKTEGQVYTTLSTQTFDNELKENVKTGADASQLQDNAFVIFNKKGIIEETAGSNFTGGSNTTGVNAGAYSNFLNLLESRSFDVLVYDGDDKQVKQLFTAFTKRMRDEVGKYFQTVLYNYPDADHEGVISVFNKVTPVGTSIKNSSLTLWYAGYSAAIDLNNELTSKRYDGELEVDTSTPDSQLEILVGDGQAVFHRVSDTEVYTLFDVNTLTTFTEEKDRQMSENKVIRIIDYLHNTESYQLNRNDIGRTPNTEEGRALIWNECYDILSDLQSSGAITNFNPQSLTVDPVPSDPHAVKIEQTFSVTGTIYRIYITTYVVQ